MNESRIMVLYSSETGNTEKAARLVETGALSVPQTEVRCLSTADATIDDLYWAEGVAAGSPTNLGTLSWDMKRWWDVVALDAWQKIDGKLGCAFSTQGGNGGGAELTCMALQIVMQNFGMLTFGITDYVASGWTLHYGSTLFRAPRDERDQASAERLGRRLAEWVGIYFHGRQALHPNHAEYQRRY